MVKGKGIFVNPASAAAPAKLRVLYEVGPIAYLIEKAGGKSSDGENSALDIKIPHTEVQRRLWHLEPEVSLFREMGEKGKRPHQAESQSQCRVHALKKLHSTLDVI